MKIICLMLIMLALLMETSLGFHSFFGFYHTSCSRGLRMSTPGGTTPLVANGKRIEAVPGSSLMESCKKLGLRVPTKCGKGECGTCTVTVAGNKIRACIGKVPPAPRLKSLIEKGLSVSVDN